MNPRILHRLQAMSQVQPNRPFGSIFNVMVDLMMLGWAYDRVRRGKGANTPGIDGATCEQIEREGKGGFLLNLHRDLVTKSYRPNALLEVSIKQGHKSRLLSIPTIRDRVVLTALMLVLRAICEPHMAPSCWGYRPGRSVIAAVRNVLYAANLGYKLTVIKVDIAEFFPSVAHDRLLAQIRERVTDRRVLDLLRTLLGVQVKTRSGIMIPCAGLPQGSPLSPLLANIFLSPVHHAFDNVGDVVARWYADDALLLVAGPRERAKEVLDRLHQQLVLLGLQLAAHKTIITTFDEGVTFLGFDLKRRGDLVEARPARSSMMKFAERLAIHGSQLLQPWRAHHAPIVALEVLDECERELIAIAASISSPHVPPAPPQDFPASGPDAPSEPVSRERIERPEPAAHPEAGCGTQVVRITANDMLSLICSYEQDGRGGWGSCCKPAWGPAPNSAGSWAARSLSSLTTTITNQEHNTMMTSSLAEHPTETTAASQDHKQEHPKKKTRKPVVATEVLVGQALKQLGLAPKVKPIDLTKKRIDMMRVPSALLWTEYDKALGMHDYVAELLPQLRSRHQEAIVERKRHEAEFKMKARAQSNGSNSLDELLQVDGGYRKRARKELVAQELVQRVEAQVRIYEKHMEVISRLITLRGQDLEQERLARK